MALMTRDLKIALVHDDLIQHGGAERLFEAMIEIWPQADVFTSMVSDYWKSEILNPKFETNPKSQFLKLKTSFMQGLPFKEKLYRHYFLLYPLAFESFDLTGYDVVVSSSTRFAHGIITKPETLHIAYINTPPRMVWEPFTYFESSSLLRATLTPFLSWLRLWDLVAAQRPDVLIANSKTPQARIKKYYGRESEIIYPFVDLARFEGDYFLSEAKNARFSSVARGSYFLVVSRLAAWKRIDIAIEACNQLSLQLKIIGEGPDRSRLQKIAGPTVEFLGRLTDEEVVRYYKGCRAFLFPQKEDFGITPLETMACGKPVVAYAAGGALETVLDGVTGRFFKPQTVVALANVLKRFNPSEFRRGDCVSQAERFAKKRFQTELKDFLEKSYETHTRSLRAL
jgi:glycosyltransferase involved in cell wall biosynthesis